MIFIWRLKILSYSFFYFNFISKERKEGRKKKEKERKEGRKRKEDYNLRIVFLEQVGHFLKKIGENYLL